MKLAYQRMSTDNNTLTNSRFVFFCVIVMSSSRGNVQTTKSEFTLRYYYRQIRYRDSWRVAWVTSIKEKCGTRGERYCARSKRLIIRVFKKVGRRNKTQPGNKRCVLVLRVSALDFSYSATYLNLDYLICRALPTSIWINAFHSLLNELPAFSQKQLDGSGQARKVRQMI